MHPTATKPKIILAEDHTLVAEGITKLLETDYHLVEVVSDGRSLLDAVKNVPPDLVLVDLSLPFLNGLDATRQITHLFPGIRVVILTMHDDPHLVEDAVAAGASGYVLKESAASELLCALQEAIAGRTYFRSSKIPHKQETASASRKFSQTQMSTPLTPRQREVLQLIAEGRTNKEIAAILGLAVKTVEFHKTRLMRTLNIHSIPQLTTFAITKRITLGK